jgi:hypothetical protein
MGADGEQAFASSASALMGFPVWGRAHECLGPGVCFSHAVPSGLSEERPEDLAAGPGSEHGL